MMVSSRGALVVRLCNWVGEVVLSIPALQRLEDAGYTLQLYGKGWAPALLAGSCWPVLVRQGGLGTARRQLRQLRRELAAAHPRVPPQSLLFTRSLSSALEMRLAGLRPCGYAYDGRSLLLAQAYERPKGLHAAQEYWHVVSRFLGEDAPYPQEVVFAPSAEQHARALSLLAEQGITPGEYLIFCPFSGGDDHEDRKVWPGFAMLTQRVRAQGMCVVVCPGPGEAAVAATRVPGAVLLKDVDMGIYGALLMMAKAVVANDTGPGHLAAACGVKLISLYGPYSVAAWAPLGSNVTLLHDRTSWPGADQVAALLPA